MNLKNKSQRVICIDETRIVPNQLATVDDSFKKNPIIAAMLKAGDLEEVTKEVHLDERATLADFEAMLETEPNYKQLQAFARKNSIDASGAKGVEELTAVIKATLSV